MTKTFFRIKLGGKKRGHKFGPCFRTTGTWSTSLYFSINFLPPLLLQICIKIACSVKFFNEKCNSFSTFKIGWNNNEVTNSKQAKRISHAFPVLTIQLSLTFSHVQNNVTFSALFAHFLLASYTLPLLGSLSSFENMACWRKSCCHHYVGRQNFWTTSRFWVRSWLKVQVAFGDIAPKAQQCHS